MQILQIRDCQRWKSLKHQPEYSVSQNSLCVIREPQGLIKNIFTFCFYCNLKTNKQKQYILDYLVGHLIIKYCHASSEAIFVCDHSCNGANYHLQ